MHRKVSFHALICSCGFPEQAATRGISPGGDDSEGSGESDQERAPARGRASRSGQAPKTGAPTRRRGAGAQEPGPPVEGALVRIDAWPMEGPDGQPPSRMVSKGGHLSSRVATIRQRQLAWFLYLACSADPECSARC